MSLSYTVRIASCLTLLWRSIEASCQCEEVCPSYTRGVWQVSSDCPAAGFKRCETIFVDYDGVVHCTHWEKVDEGGCVCNVFGCNCEACGCTSGGGLRLSPLTSNPKADACEDYNFYMSMSEEERSLLLIEKHCSSSGSPPYNAIDLLSTLENLADSNRDGKLDCPEFNAASFSFDASILCGGGGL